MAKRKSSQKGKGTFAAYKTEGRALKNKIARLERRVKSHPNDEVAKAALKRAKAGKMTLRAASRNKGNFPPAKTFITVNGWQKVEMGDFTPAFMKQDA